MNDDDDYDNDDYDDDQDYKSLSVLKGQSNLRI